LNVGKTPIAENQNYSTVFYSLKTGLLKENFNAGKVELVFGTKNYASSVPVTPSQHLSELLSVQCEL